MGVKNVRKRISLYNRKERTQIKYDRSNQSSCVVVKVIMPQNKSALAEHEPRDSHDYTSHDE